MPLSNERQYINIATREIVQARRYSPWIPDPAVTISLTPTPGKPNQFKQTIETATGTKEIVGGDWIVACSEGTLHFATFAFRKYFEPDYTHMMKVNNPAGQPVGDHTGRCGLCGSKDLWDDCTAYGCNYCGALFCFGDGNLLVPANLGGR
jgi:hypothetical protein